MSHYEIFGHDYSLYLLCFENIIESWIAYEMTVCGK